MSFTKQIQKSLENRKVQGWILIVIGSLTVVTFAYIGWSSRDTRIVDYMAESRELIRQGYRPESLSCQCECKYFDDILCLKPWEKAEDNSLVCTDDHEELVRPGGWRFGGRCWAYEGYSCLGFSKKNVGNGKSLPIYGYYSNCKN